MIRLATQQRDDARGRLCGRRTVSQAVRVCLRVFGPLVSFRAHQTECRMLKNSSAFSPASRDSLSHPPSGTRTTPMRHLRRKPHFPARLSPSSRARLSHRPPGSLNIPRPDESKDFAMSKLRQHSTEGERALYAFLFLF